MSLPAAPQSPARGASACAAHTFPIVPEATLTGELYFVLRECAAFYGYYFFRRGAPEFGKTAQGADFEASAVLP